MSVLAALGLAVLAGFSSSAQGPTNTSLSTVAGRAQATFVSFAGGTVLLGLMVAFIGTGDLTGIFRVPAWQLITGLYGFLVIYSVVFSTPRLGIAFTLMILMFGKLIMGAFIDAFGMFGATQMPISAQRIVGLAFVACGIVLVSISRMKSQSSNGLPGAAGSVLAALLVAVAGAGNAIQAPTLAGLSSETGSIEASLVNFVGGLICSIIYLLIVQRGKFQSFKGSKPWQYLGGFYGTIIVLIVIATTPILGVGLLVSAQMFGQLTGGMLVDSRGWFNCKRIPISSWRAAGVIAVGLGIVVLAFR